LMQISRQMQEVHSSLIRMITFNGFCFRKASVIFAKVL
jgi:hypothetical protein